MTNQIAIIILSLIFAFTLSITILAFIKKRKHRIFKKFIFLTICLLCWQLTSIAFFITKNPTVASYLFDLKIPFVAFSALALLIFTFDFYRAKGFGKNPIVPLVIVSIIPIITTIISLTSPWHTLLRQSLTIHISPILNTADNVRGIWFWIHAIYCYLIMFIDILIGLYQHSRLPKGQRTASYSLILGILLVVFANILVLLNVFTSPLDITLIGMSIAIVFVYFAMAHHKRLDFLIFAHTEVFNYMKEVVLIIDPKQEIVNMNRSAYKWLDSIGFPLKTSSPFYVQDINKHLKNLKADIKKVSKWDEGVDIYIPEQEENTCKVYNRKKHPVLDEHKNYLGSFMTILDVTRNRQSIQNLEKTAGIDFLTGIGNRTSFDLDKAKLDQQENYPLAIILGDLNALKNINDTYGHQVGDVAISIAADILVAKTPSKAKVYRYGGDEFIVLIPSCNHQSTQNIIDEIRQGFSEYNQKNQNQQKKSTESAKNSNLRILKPKSLSISLGLAVKENKDESLKDLINTADLLMYQDKNNDRRKN